MSQFDISKYLFYVVFISFYVIGLEIPKSALDSTDPDVNRNVSQLITSKGYPVEEHEVTTKTGYIIGVQRIPRGHQRSNHIYVALGQREVRPVVLLHHGIMGTATDYLINSADQSLGFILADNGYDVWLTNARGSTYSRKHVTLSPKTSAYWQFSWDEMALEDLPVTIDYILNTTGQENLFLVGGSMGSTIILALLSEYPEYNGKVRASGLLCPVAFAGNMKNPVRLLVPFIKELTVLDGILGHDELLPGSLFEHLVTEWLCTQGPIICQNFVLALDGISQKQFNESRAPVYLGHWPGGTSVFTMGHYAQLIKSKAFRKYDFGTEENMKKYGQATPPDYPLKNITSPVALFWGLNDEMADPADVNLLAPLLKKLVVNYMIPDPEWSHGDFFFGIDANQLVYQKMLQVFKDY